MIKIPENVTVNVDGKTVSMSGPAGRLKREFTARDIAIEKTAEGLEAKGKPMRLVETINAHLKNMIEGVSKGYKKELKIIYSHFPITVEVKGEEVIIKNFVGEKEPRKSKIVGSCKVEAKGREIIISGPDKEDVGQTTANLRTATRIIGYDCRIFQDGFYPVSE